jgi:hypothetical protein
VPGLPTGAALTVVEATIIMAASASVFSILLIFLVERFLSCVQNY